MDNLRFYNALAEVPKEAQKLITGGRLKGKTDINPMWRIRALTELFGPAGFGWHTKVLRQWTESGYDGEVAAFCEIELYVKIDQEWSQPIYGVGGSAFVAKELKGLYTSDECYKMAYTDALSVACKALGVGANIYWQAGETKYNGQSSSASKPKQERAETPRFATSQQLIEIKSTGKNLEKMAEYYGVTVDTIPYEKAAELLARLSSKNQK